MTREEIAQRLQEIIDHVSDQEMEEGAHVMEDSLYVEFIEYVKATGPEPLAQLAELVLTAQDIKFDRWYS